LRLSKPPILLLLLPDWKYFFRPVPVSAEHIQCGSSRHDNYPHPISSCLCSSGSRLVIIRAGDSSTLLRPDRDSTGKPSAQWSPGTNSIWLGPQA
jgi:hypothetical protein